MLLCCLPLSRRLRRDPQARRWSPTQEPVCAHPGKFSVGENDRSRESRLWQKISASRIDVWRAERWRGFSACRSWSTLLACAWSGSRAIKRRSAWRRTVVPSERSTFRVTWNARRSFVERRIDGPVHDGRSWMVLGWALRCGWLRSQGRGRGLSNGFQPGEGVLKSGASKVKPVTIDAVASSKVVTAVSFGALAIILSLSGFDILGSSAPHLLASADLSLRYCCISSHRPRPMLPRHDFGDHCQYCVFVGGQEHVLRRD